MEPMHRLIHIRLLRMEPMHRLTHIRLTDTKVIRPHTLRTEPTQLQAIRLRTLRTEPMQLQAIRLHILRMEPMQRLVHLRLLDILRDTQVLLLQRDTSPKNSSSAVSGRFSAAAAAVWDLSGRHGTSGKLKRRNLRRWKSLKRVH
mmetsp:Transcript_127815/g.221618  ORF Transcript_127815/g.221618 Transcript_127815/m.221618 type:complete len:145 (-) Transcript_127815:1566-2000(-)